MQTYLKAAVVTLITWEARLVLARFKPRIIAVTGSVGKTSTKDAIFAALSHSLHIRKSEKGLNSETGVPLAILGSPSGWGNPIRWLLILLRGISLIVLPQVYPKWLVLEVGADRPGDIRKIARWLRPDIAVITGVPDVPSHVEYFDSPHAVLREKRALAEYLKPGGTLIIDGDEPNTRSLMSDFRGITETYGMEGGNDFYASHDEIVYEGDRPAGLRFRLNYGGSSTPVAIHGALGYPRIYAATAAIAVAKHTGVDEVTAARGLDEWTPTPGRARIIQGLRESVIIDDTYNSSPKAAMAALDTLKSVRAKRRIAVMGDMMELGRYSSSAHRAVGERAAACADMLITVGFRARAMAEAALDAGMTDVQVRSYEQFEAERAGKELEKEIQEGDVILVKGSQSMRMERTVLEIMAEPVRAAELLVRMDPDWLER